MTQKPTSLKVFITVLTITILVFLTAILFSFYHADKKYGMLLAFFMFVALAFTMVGIYAGLKYKSEEKKMKIQNRIGLIGNLVIFLFTISLMLFAALMRAR